MDGLVVVPGTPEPHPVVDLVGDEQGGAILVWNTFINSDVYALRLTGNGVVAPGWPTGGFVVSGAPGNQTDPRAAPDGAGGALISWYDARSDNGDIYATRVLPNATLAAGWATGGNPVCTATADQRNPSIAADGVGGCFIVWEDFRDSTSYDIYGQRLTGSGALASGWTQDGVPLSLAAGHQILPRVLHDGSQGVISAWEDRRADIGDVYAQRILATGSRASEWSSDGVAIAVVPRAQAGPYLAREGQRGAFISWTDCRTDTCVVYVQRVTAAGQVGPDIPPPPPIITNFNLSPPRPNPSQTSLSVTVLLPHGTSLIVEILDTAGRVVTELTNGSAMPAGEHVFSWDGRNRDGELTSPGIYFLRARTGSEIASHKIVRL